MERAALHRVGATVYAWSRMESTRWVDLAASCPLLPLDRMEDIEWVDQDPSRGVRVQPRSGPAVCRSPTLRSIAMDAIVRSGCRPGPPSPLQSVPPAPEEKAVRPRRSSAGRPARVESATAGVAGEPQPHQFLEGEGPPGFPLTWAEVKGKQAGP